MTLHISDSGSDADSEDSASEQEEQPASDEDSDAVEEPLDELVKLKYWSKQHYMHYRSLLLPDHVRVAYIAPTQQDN